MVRNNQLIQSDEELFIFGNFSKEILSNVKTFEKREPKVNEPIPEPDILCEFTDGSKTYFELTRITSEEMRKMESKAHNYFEKLRKTDEIKTEKKIENELAELDHHFGSNAIKILKTKLNKVYKCGEYKIDLLMYIKNTDHVQHLAIDVQIEIIQKYLRETKVDTIFEKVWIYDDVDKILLLEYEF